MTDDESRTRGAARAAAAGALRDLDQARKKLADAQRPFSRSVRAFGTPLGKKLGSRPECKPHYDGLVDALKAASDAIDRAKGHAEALRTISPG